MSILYPSSHPLFLPYIILYFPYFCLPFHPGPILLPFSTRLLHYTYYIPFVQPQAGSDRPCILTLFSLIIIILLSSSLSDVACLPCTLIPSLSMSQSRITDDDSGKMAISYANSLPSEHAPTLPSFREVRRSLPTVCVEVESTDHYSSCLLICTMRSNPPPISHLPVSDPATSFLLVSLMPRPSPWVTLLETTP